jgi:hypothetical protein
VVVMWCLAASRYQSEKIQKEGGSNYHGMVKVKSNLEG